MNEDDKNKLDRSFKEKARIRAAEAGRKGGRIGGKFQNRSAAEEEEYQEQSDGTYEDFQKMQAQQIIENSDFQAFCLENPEQLDYTYQANPYFRQTLSEHPDIEKKLFPGGTPPPSPDSGPS